jgi:hypothetical protein
MKNKRLIVILIYTSVQAFGQLPTTGKSIPKSAAQSVTFTPHVIVSFPNSQSKMPSAEKPLSLTNNQQDQLLIQKISQQQSQQKQFLAEIGEEINPKEVEYEFPNQNKVSGTEFYQQAFNEINQMLKGEKLLNLKRAIFLTENAYLENRMNYDWFSSGITGNADIIKKVIEQEGYNFENPTAKKWGLQQFLADTVRLKDEKGNVNFSHKPLTYDFEDPWGKQDWTKQFVTKLMQSGKGQCHSLPLLYLIMAEEMGIRAWLSYSPSHSYIKVSDPKGNLLNYETTNGYYTTDVWVQSSGYIKAEALRSGIYMDTMPKQEVIATCLTDMANGYVIKFGFDKFVLDCVDKSLEYSPNNVYALQLKADYQTYLFSYVIDQLGRPPVDRLPEFPKAYELFLKMHEIYGKIDGIGFEEMPQDAYERWLKSFETERGKQPKEIIRP